MFSWSFYTNLILNFIFIYCIFKKKVFLIKNYVHTVIVNFTKK